MFSAPWHLLMCLLPVQRLRLCWNLAGSFSPRTTRRTVKWNPRVHSCGHEGCCAAVRCNTFLDVNAIVCAHDTCAVCTGSVLAITALFHHTSRVEPPLTTVAVSCWPASGDVACVQLPSVLLGLAVTCEGSLRRREGRCSCSTHSRGFGRRRARVMCVKSVWEPHCDSAALSCTRTRDAASESANSGT